MTDTTQMMTGTAEILRRCDVLADVTASPGRVDRFYLTPEHRRANDLVAGWMREAGLRTWTDPAGNICGRREGRKAGLPALMLGSHLDSVPDAGRYDGPLGVLLAIAVAGRLRDVTLPFALEVVGFSDEEGARFNTAMLGSKAMAGQWDPGYLDAADAEGVSLREALSQFGLDPSGVAAARREPRELIGYLEAHIEQGPELESAGLPLGVVSSICGARRFALTVVGEARHAGSTPYPRRRDALIGASHAVIDIERIARRREVIATVGQLRTYPGADNVVCGRAEFSLDLRAEHDTDRDAAWGAIAVAIKKRCRQRYLQFTARETHSAPAVSCAAWLRHAVAEGICATGQSHAPVLYSRPGHDAMVLARVTDVGMIFLRCAGGISHHPAEAVQARDVAAAADAFEAAVLAVAGAGGDARPQPCRLPSAG